jgi:hypothetical protein
MLSETYSARVKGNQAETGQTKETKGTAPERHAVDCAVELQPWTPRHAGGKAQIAVCKTLIP